MLISHISYSIDYYRHTKVLLIFFKPQTKSLRMNLGFVIYKPMFQNQIQKEMWLPFYQDK